MGAPKRGSDPAMHASYVLLSNDNALPAGVPPPQPNIASFPPRRFPWTRQRPQAQIDGEAASKARAQQAIAHMQTMMAAAVEAARKIFSHRLLASADPSLGREQNAQSPDRLLEHARGSDRKGRFSYFFPQHIHIHYHAIRRPPCGAGPS